MRTSLCSTLVVAFTWLTAEVLAITPSFPYGSEKVRGVSLGSWLVLEPWLKHSLFDATNNPAIVDEWTFCQLQDRDVAESALRDHWNTWITEADFVSIAAAGLTHVRIPIGYWAFEVGPDEPFIQGQLEYLQNAVAWASRYNVKVIIDLHGAPGSQNGFPESGRKLGFPLWHSNTTNIARTNAVIKTITSMFKDQADTVPIIAPLNEPAGFYGQAVLSATKQFWRDSYASIRFPNGDSQKSSVVELIHDAFQPLSYWNGFLTAPEYEGVAIDTHIYQVFSQDDLSKTQEQHISAACATQSYVSNFDLGVIVGEWSPAITDCAASTNLNANYSGSAYDGTLPGSSRIGSCDGFSGKASTFSSSYKVFLRKFWEAQVISYEKGHGWIQWTWKTENADDWSYQAGLVNGWIPLDPTDLMYPDICSSSSGRRSMYV